MRDVIPVATLVLARILMLALGGLLNYELLSGSISKRNMLAKADKTPWQRLAGDRLAISCSWLFLV